MCGEPETEIPVRDRLRVVVGMKNRPSAVGTTMIGEPGAWRRLP
jgi:hypothetical protein